MSDRPARARARSASRDGGVPRSFQAAVALALAIGTGCVPLGGPPPHPPELDPDLVQRGGRLFMDPTFSGAGARSCATCHPGGGTNGRVYLEGVEVDPRTPGARDVPALWGVWQTGPYLADGSLGSIGEVVSRMLRTEMQGSSISDPDRRALEAYVLSIPPFDRRRTLEDGTPREPVTRSAREGFRVFVEARCGLCHPPPAYMRRGRFDVGTGGSFGAPSLRGISETAPYGHDGRWSTLDEAVRGVLEGREETLSEDDRRRLLDYLRLL